MSTREALASGAKKWNALYAGWRLADCPEFGLNRAAKILCSGVLVTGRDMGETLRHSA